MECTLSRSHQPSKRAQRTLEGQPGCPMFQGIPVAFSDNRFASELAPRSFHHLASWCARRGIKLTGANGQGPMWLRPSASSLGLRNNYIIHQLWYIWIDDKFKDICCWNLMDSIGCTFSHLSIPAWILMVESKIAMQGHMIGKHRFHIANCWVGIPLH